MIGLANLTHGTPSAEKQSVRIDEGAPGRDVRAILKAYSPVVAGGR